jgi:hypothetical protein
MVISALKYMPETSWDDSTCAINFPTACTSVDPNGFDIAAGSGGPSTCAVASGSNCVGYAKPSYQVGITPGTTGLTTRLQPDVSLFSSNGQNGVSLIVCEADANPNGVACDLNAPYNDFTLVGGTSAATPTFAAIMALVNQKTGQRQGNANYVLYGLAAKDTNYTAGKCNASVGNTPAATCVYNDVSKGNNSVACIAGSPNCSNTTASGFGIEIFQNATTPAFATAAGYDLATGLGSINVTNLLNSWSSFSRTATTTTLSGQSGNTNVSGQNFSVTVTVAPAGAAGDVSLIATTPTGTAGFGPYTLSGGSVTATTNLLPPGTTSVVGYYGGDATHAASPSAPLTLTPPVSGAGMGSTTTLSFVTYSGNTPVLNSSGNVAYGTAYILQAKVKGSTDCAAALNYPVTKQTIPCPTGSVAFTDNGAPLNDFPNGATPNATNVAKLNNLGIAEDQPIQLGVGSHSIVAAYTSADTNYSSSTSNTLAVTITKAATATAVSSSLASFTPGTSVTLTATIGTNSNSSEGPTGTVQFSNGSTSLGAAVKCTPTASTSTTAASCAATMTTTISALYPPPQGRPGRPIAPWMLVGIAALCVAMYFAGLRRMPEKRRHACAYAGMIAFALLAIAIAGCGGGGGGGGGGNGTRTINAAYSGDANYSSSTGSTTVTIQ